MLEPCAVFEGGGESDMIGIREIYAEWEATGETSNFYIWVALLEHFLE